MSIDHLIDTLEKEASAREDRLLEDARKEAEESLSRARARAEELDRETAEEKERLARMDETFRNARERLGRNYAATARRHIFLNAVKEKCGEFYKNRMASKPYGKLVERDCREALRRAGEDAAFTADPVTAGALKDVGARKVSVVEDFGPGFTAESADGEVQVDATMQKKLEKLWPSVTPELLDRYRKEEGR